MNLLLKTITAISAALISLILQTQTIAQNQAFRAPVAGGRVICVFDTKSCYVSGKYHTAIDYGATISRDVLASNSGKVVITQKNGDNDHGLGNAIVVEHVILNLQGGREQVYSLYGHLESFVEGLKPGDTVDKGQKLGKMGGTGKGKIDTWSVHLHFEIKRKPILHNPYGTGQFWGYTPQSAVTYGYLDPIWLINSGISVVSNAAATEKKSEGSDSKADLSGEWNADGYGGRIRVNIRQIGNRVTATKLTNYTQVPAGQVTWEGTYTSNRFSGRLQISRDNYQNPRWVSVVINVLDKDHITVVQTEKDPETGQLWGPFTFERVR